MIHYVAGNILDSDCEALVNPVNCVGASGAGLAKRFAFRWPGYERTYRAACKRGQVKLGEVGWFPIEDGRRIIAFPTKDHWRNPSQIEWIKGGLKSLHDLIERDGIKSIAIPALGCGNGGLRWSDVRYEIEYWLHPLNIRIDVYPPQ